jgi:diguanylate cyclase (GGDEF)-like protein
MENEMKRSHRYGRKFSILILDMDLFKKVNDEYGHNVGDAVLSQLVRIIDREIRDSDILSRWGGEEFLVVMPETVINGAIIMAERIRKAVEKADFPQVFNQTCSLGVTTFRLGEHIEETIDRADRALYEAKRKGRNCVVAS